MMAGRVGMRRRHKAEPGQGAALASARTRALFNRFDIAEILVRARSADVVNLLADFACDPALPPEFRRACANEVLDRACGPVQRKLCFQNLDPDAPIGDGTGRTIKDYIAEKTAEASKLLEAQGYIGKMPIEDWPQWVIDLDVPNDLKELIRPVESERS